jgi:hypothetical protein
MAQRPAWTEDDPAGWALLTSPAIGDLLTTAVGHAGGVLRSWQLSEVDATPGRQTTATYRTAVTWPFGDRGELLGVSARAGGAAGTDADAAIFAAGDRQVAVWLYPRDPDLPGLARAALPDRVAALVTEHRLAPWPVQPEQVTLDLVGYRPRRRAVVRARLRPGPAAPGNGFAPTTGLPPGPAGELVLYLKVLTAEAVAPTVQRHEMLGAAGLPVPPVLAVTSDQIVVLPQLPGRPLAEAIFDAEPPCTGEALVDLLDRLPTPAAELPRRVTWSSAIQQYAHLVAAALPGLGPRLEWLVEAVTSGLANLPTGVEPTHGDFHEGQVFVGGGGPVGLLDIDRVGPGRRAEDLACLLSHLSTIQGMSPEQEQRVAGVITTWRSVFEERVDRAELRLRAAAITVSLATGPYRSQRPGWQAETEHIVSVAERMVASIP